MTVNVNREVKWPECRHKNKRRMMAAFDKMPADVRHALSEAHANYCPACLLRSIPPGMPSSVVVAALKAADRLYEQKSRALLDGRSR